MAWIRAYRRRLLWLPALAVSGVAQATAILSYAVTRPTPQPYLTVRVKGEGSGQVLVTRDGVPAPILRCSTPRCRIEIPNDASVHLVAIPGDGSTFGGYTQFPMRTPAALVPYLGDPIAACSTQDIMAAAAKGDVRDCALTVHGDTDLAVEFGSVPKEIEVAVGPVKLDDVLKPLIAPKPQIKKAPPPPIDKPLEVAIAPPKLQPPKIQPPPPPPPPQDKPKPPQPPPPNMVAVEVEDKNNVDKAPDDATHLSDKNRNVDKETRATDTNLDKQSNGKQVASAPSPDLTSTQVGGADEKIRQLEDTQKTTDKHIQETDHSGDKEVAKGQLQGEGGDNGDEGTGDKAPSILAMRGIAGRGKITDQTPDGKKAGKHGTPGINTPLAFNDYERIVGKDKAENERAVAARKMSAHKGKWEAKLDAIKSSLENFVPDVQPGNQTALKTRAHPFALYIARMHRRIHELWGFGYLEALDSKGANDPLNNPDLWVNLEMSVNTDGSVHKVTIAKTSGSTEFDVAAVNTVISAGPYETTPEAIRSVDGRIYLRWGFYRNWRQCGTFNVEPYILTSVPTDSGTGVLDDGAMVANVAHVPGSKKMPPVGDKPVTPDDGLGSQKVSPSSSVTDKGAVFTANVWITGFATAQIDKLVSNSIAPFYANGAVAAQTTGDLKDMYSQLIVESGPMKDWKLLSGAEYAQKSGGASLPAGNNVIVVQCAKSSFAIVLTQSKSGDWRATQLAH